MFKIKLWNIAPCPERISKATNYFDTFSTEMEAWSTSNRMVLTKTYKTQSADSWNLLLLLVFFCFCNRGEVIHDKILPSIYEELRSTWASPTRSGLPFGRSNELNSRDDSKRECEGAAMWLSNLTNFTSPSLIITSPATFLLWVLVIWNLRCAEGWDPLLVWKDNWGQAKTSEAAIEEAPPPQHIVLPFIIMINIISNKGS